MHVCQKTALYLLIIICLNIISTGNIYFREKQYFREKNIIPHEKTNNKL